MAKFLLDIQLFAEPVAGGTHKTREKWSDMLLKKLRKENVFAQLFNRKYDSGNPTAGLVKIPVRDTEVKVKKYDVVKGVDLDTSTTTFKDLLIDQSEAVNELIDGYEAEAVPANLVADRLDSAGYSLGRSLDINLCTLLSTQATGQAEGNTTELTEDTIYTNIIKDIAKAKKLGLKKSELWLAVTTDTYTLLQLSPKFIQATAKGDSVIATGEVGTIGGVKVYETNGIGEDLNIEYILGNNVFCHYVPCWKKELAINTLTDGKHIGASALQGRRMWGRMISRPETVFVKKKV